MICFIIQEVVPGSSESRTRILHHDESSPSLCTLDMIINKGRRLMMEPNVSSVTIVSRECQLTLLHHNEFNGSLILGSPKPNRRNWGRTWSGAKERSFGNNVRVLTRWHPERGFAAYAIYNGRVLNRLDAANEREVEEKYRLLCGAWKRATQGNVKDEAQDAPEWTET